VSRPASQTVAAEDVIVAVETYADRLHDLLRRRGLGVADATAIVRRSGEDLVEAAVSESPADPLGWWWARALSMGERTRTTATLSSRDEDPVDVALAQLTPPLQLAVLLRDDYDLPLSSVAVALGVGRAVTADRVLQGRLELVAAHDGVPVVDASGHDARDALDPIGLLGVADGTLGPAEAARMRRHLRGCSTCEAIVASSQRGRRLAAALPVKALADEPRDALVQTVRERAAQLLPALADLLTAQQDEDAAASVRSLVSLPVIVVSLACALVLGALTGAVTAPGDSSPRASGPDDGGVSATDTPTGLPTATPTATPTPSATPTARRTTTPSARPTAARTTAPPVVAGPPRISIDPSSGPNNQPVEVTGAGWTAGTNVTVSYVNLLGQTTSSVVVSVESNGTFATTLYCSDPVPGQHTIRASDGVSTASQPYTQR
jgi:DNA-directed RNA polymerase specialized sigma24 family protein